MRRSKKASAYLVAESIVVFLRMRRGLTQQALAEACGISPMDVSKIERKDYGIQLWKLQQLAAFLGVALEVIVPDSILSSPP